MRRRELNDRFKAHIAKSRRVRVMAASLLCVCLLAGAGAAFATIAPETAIVASVQHARADALAAFRAFSRSSGHVAAAASSSWFDRLLCAVLRNCAAEAKPDVMVTERRLPAPQDQPRAAAPAPVMPAMPARAAPQTVQQTIVQQPVIERIRETVRTVEGGVAAAYLDERMALLAQSLQSQIAAVASGASSQSATIYQTLGMVGRIEELSNTKLHTPTIDGASISGGTISGATISGTIDALINTVAATIADLTATTITATNATFGNSTTTNATTTNLAVTGRATIGSGTGVVQTQSGVVSAIALGADGQVLKIVGGAPTWSTDLSGGGGGASAWATSSNDLAIVQSDPTDVVVIGALATSTTGSILEVAGNSLFRQLVTAYQTVSAPSFTATSSTASILPYASTTAITATTASTSALIISGAPGGLLKTSAAGAVSVATAGVDYLNSTIGDWTGTLGGFSAAQLIAAGFSTTSADIWKSNRSFFATTSTDYWKTQNDFFATTSADAWKAMRSFFATTSSDFWLTQQSTDNLSQGAANKYYATSLFAADLAGTTTDALAEGSTNKYWSNTLFDARLSATTSLPNIITLASLSLPAAQLSGFGVPFYQYFSATTTSALSEGSNLYFTPNRVAAVIAARRQPRSRRARTNTSPTLAPTRASTQPRRSARSRAHRHSARSQRRSPGFLKATAGVLSAALVDLASDVTGILGVANGGTGGAIAAGAVVLGNGTGVARNDHRRARTARCSRSSADVPTWVATTTLSTISGTLAAGSEVPASRTPRRRHPPRLVRGRKLAATRNVLAQHSIPTISSKAQATSSSRTRSSSPSSTLHRQSRRPTRATPSRAATFSRAPFRSWEPPNSQIPATSSA